MGKNGIRHLNSAFNCPVSIFSRFQKHILYFVVLPCSKFEMCKDRRNLGGGQLAEF